MNGITGPINEQQSQQLARIKASARHLLSLIDEILTFTRIDAGLTRDAGSRFDATIGGSTDDYFLRLGFTLEKTPGNTDGMKVDRSGNIYCSAPGGI